MTFYLVEMFDHQDSECYVTLDVGLRFEDAVKRMNDYILRLTNGEFSAWGFAGSGDYCYLKEQIPNGRVYEFQIREVTFH